MGAATVLVAFASQTGSTAAIAEVIAAELRDAGFAVECRAASDIDTLEPYAALVLGSGIFVRSRHADGGGFLARHERSIATRPVWLFCSGPIGRGRSADAVPDPTASDDSSVMDVARAIGARGAAAFGTTGLADDARLDAIGRPVDVTRVRAWSHTIATELEQLPLAAAS